MPVPIAAATATVSKLTGIVKGAGGVIGGIKNLFGGGGSKQTAYGYSQGWLDKRFSDPKAFRSVWRSGYFRDHPNELPAGTTWGDFYLQLFGWRWSEIEPGLSPFAATERFQFRVENGRIIIDPALSTEDRQRAKRLVADMWSGGVEEEQESSIFDISSKVPDPKNALATMSKTNMMLIVGAVVVGGALLMARGK